MSILLNNQYIKHGIVYEKPFVKLLNEPNLAISEIAARTCYNSFLKSDSELMAFFPSNKVLPDDIEESKLLENLSWAYQHESVLEHINLNFYIQGLSRGVLQELARHRIASYSVKSTRYTMNTILNAYIASEHKRDFQELIDPLNLFVVQHKFKYIEINQLLDKLEFQEIELQEEFYKIAASKEQRDYIFSKTFRKETQEKRFKKLKTMKQKRNVGDAFKWIVTDNWKTDLMWTINLRSLKNFLKLRNSGAAWFQMKIFAEEIEKQIPEQFKKLIVKQN